MADEKLNTGPAENISPEAAEPITTPEQAAASEPQQEQTGPAIPESGDVVVSFDKINELMAEREAERPRRSRKVGTPKRQRRQPRRNTAARQYGGTEKAAPWPSAESGKGCD